MSVATIGALAGCSSGGSEQAGSTSESADPAETSEPTTTTQPRQTETPARPVQTSKLVAEQDTLSFGAAIAASEATETALISAPAELSGTGPVYAFSRTNNTWEQTARLLPDRSDSDEYFGGAVALSESGRTALIGSPKDNDPHGTTSGSVWAYTLNEGSWELETTLTASDGKELDNFGSGVDVSADGTTAVIEAERDESVYVFMKTDSGWAEQTKIAVPYASSRNALGRNLELSRDGTTALIGASAGDRVGSAYVVSQNNGQWSQERELSPPTDADVNSFGHAVGLSEDGATALVSAPLEPVTPGEEGPVFVYSYDGQGWTRQSRFDPPEDGEKYLFGRSICLLDGGSIALVGAPHKEMVFVFERSDSTWVEQARLTPEDGDGGSKFGDVIEPLGKNRTALIGAPGDDAPSGYSGAGSVYVFEV